MKPTDKDKEINEKIDEIVRELSLGKQKKIRLAVNPRHEYKR